jgi:CMP-N,N'-diacetyllegionaminic acid synthase
MINAKRFIAVIPARGGSKGVPRKNIKLLAGRPLIAYTIDQARSVAELDRVVVSTDDREIRATALALGAEVIDRPADLATAEARTEAALLHVLDAVAQRGEQFDYIVVLEPTSPFRSPDLIRESLRLITTADAESLLAVRAVHEITGTIDDGGYFRPFVPGQPRRRQERTPSFGEASTIYICRVDYLRRTGSLVAEDWLAIEVPAEQAVDINTPEDFEYCEFLLERRLRSV